MDRYNHNKILFILMLFISCNSAVEQKGKVVETEKLSPGKARTVIIIQPFVGLPINEARQVQLELKKMYSGSIVLNTAIPFPSHTLNQSRSRYRADSLIKYLSKVTRQGYLTIGLTNRDISATKGNIQDWGIMGLGYCPGRSCIASTYRLKGGNRAEKLFKVAIHELGHTQGLQHCPDKFCLMRDAEGKDHLNEEKGFCKKCKSVLVKAGWVLI